ncbi:hypothetical protein UlMin_013165 [Ulmus minor]
MDQSLINLKNVITKLNEWIQLTHETLMSYIRDRSTPQSLFLAKEAEMKSLKKQLASLQSQLQQRQQATMADPMPWMFSTLPKVPQPLPLAAPSAEPSILQLRRILEDKIKKEADHKGKKTQAEPKASDQFMFQTFTLDDLPPSKWRTRFQEFRAWTLLEAQKPRAHPRTILLQFVSRFTGILQDWWINLGEYRQIQFLQIASVELALDHIYTEFCGQEAQVTERMRAEFFKMKFYLIGGVDDPNLKQAFLSSIPDPLGEETFRLLSTSGKTLQNTTLGELYQLVLRALEKMCSHNKFIQEYMKQTKKLDKVYNQKELQIKCPSHSSCSCSTKIRKYKKYKHYDKSSKSYKFKRQFNNKKGPWKFLCRKKKFGKSSNRCYLSGMKCHFAKQCPKGKTAKLISHIQESTGISLSDNDVESIFSVDEEITPETLCALQPYSDCSDSDDQESFYKMTAINSVQLVPIVKMQVIPSKYSLPIKVTAFFDTGASFTIMNPDILPK